MKASLKSSLILTLLHAVATSAAVTATNIAQGCWANHSLFLKSDGSLWGMGNDRYNQIAYHDFTPHAPVEIVAGNVTEVASGGSHSLFLMSNGSLWGIGDNTQGALGLTASADQPKEIPLNNVRAIAAGQGYSLFLKSDGSLWGVGQDTLGQLGDGGFYENYPGGPFIIEQIVASDVTTIAAGYGHSLFIKSDGSLWAMGWNGFGQLGDGNEFYPSLYSDNVQYRTNLPEQVVASDVTAIAAGSAHSLFLKSDGSLWTMGRNFEGQLGNGTYISTNQPQLIVASNVTAIAAGGYHSLFIKSDGSLWAMGDFHYGQLGDGNNGLHQ